MLSIAAASQRQIASLAFQVCHMSKRSCFWGINQNFRAAFFFTLVTLRQGIHADVDILPQECCCGSICKWLITRKEQDKKVPVGDEAPMDASGVSRRYSVFLSLFACLSSAWTWRTASKHEWERSATLGNGNEVTDPSVSTARSARPCLWVAWIFLMVRGTRCSLVKDVANIQPTACWSSFQPVGLTACRMAVGPSSRAVWESGISAQMDLCKLLVRLLDSWVLQFRLDLHLGATEQFIWWTWNQADFHQRRWWGVEIKPAFKAIKNLSFSWRWILQGLCGGNSHWLQHTRRA